MANESEWYQKTEGEALDAQQSSLEHGISHQEAVRRRNEFGGNVIQGATRRGPWRIFLSQFSDFLVLILIAAAFIASFLGEPQDSVAIGAIILLNATLGFIQEYRAEKAIEALRALAAPQAKVRRLGEIIFVPAFELVPGDIVLLEAGNVVPADLRIIETFQFRVDESALTGESQPVEKLSRSLNVVQLGVADQANMAFKGTVVVAGRATGLVVRTGMATELGRIAKLLKEEVEVKTPLQQKLARFAKGLAFVVLALCAVIFLVGTVQGENPGLMFMTAVSLAVAAIPEALPAVVTVSLALGARTMSKQNALIRKLPAVESLGSVTYICSDKTGTLTENRMKLRGLHVAGSFCSAIPEDITSEENGRMLLKILALNNDVTFGANGELQGDPTEIALVEAALSSGSDKRTLEANFPRIAELPFSSERGMMTTIHQVTSDESIALVKGAPEKVLPRCKASGVMQSEYAFNLDIATRTVEEMGAQGLRVLALAFRNVIGNPSDISLGELESELNFVALVGLMDSPRKEVKNAIQACHSAGIQVVMITGDHPVTARAIAEQLGIMHSERPFILTGKELMELEESEFQKKALEVAVYARVAPEQKIRIVKALKRQGQIVAMTGDGVNDAPALKSADVGVAMGRGGTDVAREASHVILLDDHFATIVVAVREGRRIYDNIRKFIRFALSGNSGEVWTLFLAPFVGLPTPLLPIHILWVNLITDGLPGLALALEPAEKDVMSRKPRSPQESVFSHGLLQHAFWVGLLIAASTLGTMAWAYHTGHAHWQSMTFTVLTFVQMGHVLAIRSESESLFTQGLRSNLPLLFAVILTLGLQLCTLYLQPLNRIFKTTPLSLSELLICLGVSCSAFIAVEVEKWLRRRRNDS